MRTLVHALVATFVLLMLACGDGSQGDSCDNEGQTDGCDDGLVCGHHKQGEGLTCLKSCTADGDCLATDTCGGLKGSLKGCVSR